MALTQEYSCNANTIVGNAKCYLEPNMGAEQRAAIKLLARVQNLAAIGGTNYANNFDQLMKDAALWRGFALNQRDAINTYEAVQDAIVDGASLSTNISTQKAQSACYLKMGKEDKLNVLAYLSCAIKSAVKPD